MTAQFAFDFDPPPSGRWWWDGFTGSCKSAAGEKRTFVALGLVHETSTLGVPQFVRPPRNASSGGTIGVQDVSRWIDHIEGLPPR